MGEVVLNMMGTSDSSLSFDRIWHSALPRC